MSLRTYLEKIREHWAGGAATPENTYVPSLVALLDECLDDDVTPWPRGNAAGLPDVGLRVNGVIEGFVEAEAIRTPLTSNAKGQEQAERYSMEAPTLLTNFHEFWVYDRGEIVRTYSFSRDELLAQPVKDVAREHGAEVIALFRFWAGLRTPISDASALADRLAEYARWSLQRVEMADRDTLTPLRRAMEEALGFSFEGQRAEHFFASSVVQALFYGLFSAWVESVRRGQRSPTDVTTAAELLDVPVISHLFEELTQPRRLRGLGLEGPVTWALEALNRVVPDGFMRAFAEGEAVQYFYEPFLEKFDRALRRELAVWYTPREIVRYQVQRTDELLRDELGIRDGLLDERVVVLDPAAGTGSYLLEIARFMRERLGDDPLAGHVIRQAFASRIIGFEILPAPYAIAHLQVGLYLRDIGAPLQPGERAAIYLTNSLVGWDEADPDAPQPIWPDFARERELADTIKHDQPVLVVMGNPPYARFTAQAEDEQADLIEPYKACLRQTWEVRRNTLDDLYVRFLRLAERQIAERAPMSGIVSFITNRSYLTGLSHPVMREHLLTSFDKLFIDDLHGALRAGRQGDGNVFTTDWAAGITVGVAVSHLVKSSESRDLGTVSYREIRTGTGDQKRHELLQSSGGERTTFTPSRENRYSFRPLAGEDRYLTWPRIVDLFPIRFSGVQASRDAGPMAFEYEAQALKLRMRDYYDGAIGADELRERYPDLMRNGARYDAETERHANLRASRYREDRIVEYQYRPMDRRLLYWEEHGKLLVEKRREFFDQLGDGNRFIVANQVEERSVPFDRCLISSRLVEFHILRPDARAFPMRVHHESLFTGEGGVVLPNLADYYDQFVQYGLVSQPGPGSRCTPPPRPDPLLPRFGVAALEEDGRPTGDGARVAEDLFFYAIGVLSSPSFGQLFSEYLKDDWPRIPLPESTVQLRSVALLGRRLADLLDPYANQDDRLEAYGAIRFEGSAAELTLNTRFTWRDEAIEVSRGLSLHNVPRAVWEFTLGGYPVLASWLGARSGRDVTASELRQFENMARRIAGALAVRAELEAVVAPILTITN